MKRNSESGYILILTLMMLSVLIITITRVFYQSSAHMAFSNTMIEAQKAKQLALSGLQIAISNLTIPSKELKQEGNESGKEDKSKEVDDKDRTFLQRILPHLNLWQKIELTEEKDGIDGNIEFCICCENGKLNINEIYKISKIQKDKKDKSKELEGLTEIINFMKFKDFLGGNFFPELQAFLDQRKYPLNDPTELLNINSFKYFNDYIFYNPDILKESKPQVYLMDLFTIWTGSLKVQPWLLSNSLRVVLGLKTTQEKTDKTKEVEKCLKNFKNGSQWSKDWDNTLKPIYEKDFNSFPKSIELLFESKFEPRVFSVISKGTVGSISKKLYVILQIGILKQEEVSFDIVKLYWA